MDSAHCWNIPYHKIVFAGCSFSKRCDHEPIWKIYHVWCNVLLLIIYFTWYVLRQGDLNFRQRDEDYLNHNWPGSLRVSHLYDKLWSIYHSCNIHVKSLHICTFQFYCITKERGINFITILFIISVVFMCTFEEVIAKFLKTWNKTIIPSSEIMVDQISRGYH